MNSVVYRNIINNDREWIEEFIKERWGSSNVVVHGSMYTPSELKGFIAEKGNEKIGLITFKMENDNCEIITIDSVIENKGVGTRLVSLVNEEAQKQNCNKIRLVTTNDNIKAIYFYQKFGFRLVKINLDSVERSRMIKPEIPIRVDNGILIKDELEFSLQLRKS